MSSTASGSSFSGFSLKETAAIRKQIVTQGARLACPRCGGTLTLGAVGLAWELRCEPCQRKLDVPHPSAPDDHLTSQ